jgi:hypothetical protein
MDKKRLELKFVNENKKAKPMLIRKTRGLLRRFKTGEYMLGLVEND